MEEGASEHAAELVWPVGPWPAGLVDRDCSEVVELRFDSFDSISTKLSSQTALHFCYSAESTKPAP